jgi:hypothetical protein
MIQYDENILKGGFYGSKDANGSEIKRKTSMLLSEGVQMEEATLRRNIKKKAQTIFKGIKVSSQYIIVNKSILAQDN